MIDPSGDNFLTPIDVLLVINYINDHSQVAGEGEGATLPDSVFVAQVNDFWSCFSSASPAKADDNRQRLTPEPLTSGSSCAPPVCLPAGFSIPPDAHNDVFAELELAWDVIDELDNALHDQRAW